MSGNTHQHSNKKYQLVLLTLVFSLIFAVLHVALHDININDLEEHETCQVCRLDNTPTASLAQPGFYYSLLSLSHTIPLEDHVFLLSFNSLVQWARAPPFSNMIAYH